MGGRTVCAARLSSLCQGGGAKAGALDGASLVVGADAGALDVGFDFEVDRGVSGECIGLGGDSVCSPPEQVAEEDDERASSARSMDGRMVWAVW